MLIQGIDAHTLVRAHCTPSPYAGLMHELEVVISGSNTIANARVQTSAILVECHGHGMQPPTAPLYCRHLHLVHLQRFIFFLCW